MNFKKILFCLFFIFGFLFLFPMSAGATSTYSNKPDQETLNKILEENPQYAENVLLKIPFVGDEKTNVGLVNFAFKAVDEQWGYVYGGKGQFMTDDVMDDIINSSINRRKYRNSTYRELTEEWLGNRATDCSGLLMDYIWWAGDNLDPIPELCEEVGQYNANNMLKEAVEKGSIDTLPEIPGVLVHKPGHVGIYIGNGKVIEAKGVGYGVVITDLDDTNWRNWSKSPWIDYDTTGIYAIHGETKLFENGYLIGTPQFAPEATAETTENTSQN